MDFFAGPAACGERQGPGPKDGHQAHRVVLQSAVGGTRRGNQWISRKASKTTGPANTRAVGTRGTVHQQKKAAATTNDNYSSTGGGKTNSDSNSNSNKSSSKAGPSTGLSTAQPKRGPDLHPQHEGGHERQRRAGEAEGGRHHSGAWAQPRHSPADAEQPAAQHQRHVQLEEKGGEGVGRATDKGNDVLEL